jgi:hypothetical protein
VPEIFRTGEEIGVMLAISLHAANDDLRDMLVPINKKYPLKELMAACKNYPGLSNARRITFEYVMLKGVNDSLDDAKRTGQAAQGHSGQDQPDPVQPVARHQLSVLDWETIEKFADFINEAGYASPIRTPRGRDILAACGQLKSESERMRKDRPDGAGSDDDRRARGRLRSKWLFALAGLLSAALASVLFNALLDTQLETGIIISTCIGGLFGGLAYWAISGRNAGIWISKASTK